MKTVNKWSLAAVTALSLISFGSVAQTISATSLTMDGAQAKISAQAHAQNEQYKILEASTNNRVHMTAELYK
ncbi:Protein of unknown function [Candidatus Pantoea varia]|uniref:YdgH/BhsA/McbA-like domain-containing protein n=1 Tax=Candidatus Pantoea varia TaxID=1881036 RepID=A0A1I5EYG1_9GAMM|nr:YdgH/BhsA/McbA-like domain containing protein [Pantoea varia]SFO16473.1 Protein of unknown function [Pantoea varia]